MSYLMLFSIGPVQSFLAQARKTIDLYSGSLLLSDWIDYCYSYLPSSSEKIFPSSNLDSKPNRFLVLIPYDENQIQELGNTIESKLREKVRNDFLESLQSSGLPISESKHKPLLEKAERQLQDFLQIHWVALPETNQPYYKTYQELERILGSIKNSKQFSQNPEFGRKCSLDGVRNALFFFTDRKNKTLPFIDPDAIRFGNGFQISSGEGLSSISFLKRFYPQATKKSYPSTSEICLYDTLHKLEKANSKELENYKKSYMATHFEEQLYYEENLNPEYFEKHGFEALTTLIPSLKSKLKSLYDSAKSQGWKFSKYYALMILDGDSMGSWLSGEKLKNPSQLKDFHSSLASALGEFARHSRNIIQKPIGKIVYAGGDDLLAFLNLNHLTTTIEELNSLFQKTVTQQLMQYLKEDAGSLTFSAGVAIAHYKTPLSEVVQVARDMESLAKSNPGKNSVSIGVLKHSGEFSYSIFRISSLSSPIQNSQNPLKLRSVLTCLQLLADSIGRDYYSSKFLKSIIQEFSPFIDKVQSENDLKILETLILTEAKRLISRAKKNKSKMEEKYELDNLITAIQCCFQNTKDLPSFFALLSIAEFIQRHLNYEN